MEQKINAMLGKECVVTLNGRVYRVKPISEGVFEVQRTRPQSKMKYTVTEESCTCQGYTSGHYRPCNHIRAVWEYLSLQRGGKR